MDKLTASLNLKITPTMKARLRRKHVKECPHGTRDFSAWLRGKLAALVKESK